MIQQIFHDTFYVDKTEVSNREADRKMIKMPSRAPFLFLVLPECRRESQFEFSHFMAGQARKAIDLRLQGEAEASRS